MRGFTLIEFLVVIAIIAILSVIVILVLNPAELLQQSRDSNRISDLSIVKHAITFYLTQVTDATVYVGTSSVCYVDASGTTAGQPTQGTSSCASWFATNFAVAPNPLVASTTIAKSRNVDGSGWIPIPFSSISPGGSPISNEPIDPLNNDGVHFYSYIAVSTSTLYKLDAHMESQKYGPGGSKDVTTADGGIDPNSYEVGSNLNL